MFFSVYDIVIFDCLQLSGILRDNESLGDMVDGFDKPSKHLQSGIKINQWFKKISSSWCSLPFTVTYSKCS